MRAQPLARPSEDARTAGAIGARGARRCSARVRQTPAATSRTNVVGSLTALAYTAPIQPWVGMNTRFSAMFKVAPATWIATRSH